MPSVGAGGGDAAEEGGGAETRVDTSGGCMAGTIANMRVSTVGAKEET